MVADGLRAVVAALFSYQIEIFLAVLAIALIATRRWHIGAGSAPAKTVKNNHRPLPANQEPPDDPL